MGSLRWQVGDTIVSSIGQGYVLTTPLQLAYLLAQVSKSKKTPNPKLNPNKSVNFIENLNFKEDTLEVLREALYAAVNKKGGTGYRAGTNIEGWEIAGKTGTAQ